MVISWKTRTQLIDSYDELLRCHVVEIIL
jgi:hypothetical protein